MGYTDEGESMTMRVQPADIKNALSLVHKMNLGGSVVVLDGGGSYSQNEEKGQRARINYEQGSASCACVAVEGRGRRRRRTC